MKVGDCETRVQIVALRVFGKRAAVPDKAAAAVLAVRDVAGVLNETVEFGDRDFKLTHGKRLGERDLVSGEFVRLLIGVAVGGAHEKLTTGQRDHFRAGSPIGQWILKDFAGFDRRRSRGECPGERLGQSLIFLVGQSGAHRYGDG